MNDLRKIYIENRGVFGLRSNRMSKYGRSFYGKPYSGYDAPQRVTTKVMEDLTGRAIKWIDSLDTDTPFFLYFSSVAVHHPIYPSERMRGTSNAGAYGDFAPTFGRHRMTICRKGTRRPCCKTAGNV